MIRALFCKISVSFVSADMMNGSIVAIQTRIIQEHFTAANHRTDKLRDYTRGAPYRVKPVPEAMVTLRTSRVEKRSPTPRYGTPNGPVLGIP